MAGTLIAVDPGKFRSGIAVMLLDGSVLERSVSLTSETADRVAQLCFKYTAEAVIIGNGGPGKALEKDFAARNIQASMIFVNEKGSTLEARGLFWKENRPRGLMRLLPASLRTPHLPYDDYAAVVIGKRYLKGLSR